MRKTAHIMPNCGKYLTMLDPFPHKHSFSNSEMSALLVRSAKDDRAKEHMAMIFKEHADR